MAEYDDWIQQAEFEEEEQQALKSSAGPRKSVVIADFSKRKESFMANSGAEAPRMSVVIGHNHQTNEEPRDQARRPSESKVFPGLTIETREEKIRKGKKEEQVAVEWKWPFALLALFFMSGGMVLMVFGGWCIKQNPTGEAPLPENELDACGPANVAGGITMLMCGFLIALASIWQLVSLRKHRRRLISTPL